MTRKYETDAERFKKRLDQLSVVHETDEISTVLGISASHAGNILHGRKPFSQIMQTKIDALISAKSNSSEKVDADLQENAKSQFSEPVAMSTGDKYVVIDAQDETAVLVEIIEPFHNHTAARRICALLNRESR